MITPLSNHATRIPLAALAGLVLAQAGCSLLKAKPDPTRFYVLRAQPAAPVAVAAGQARAEIRVGPGSIPGYLEATPIAILGGSNEVRYLGYHHWAEPLPKGISRSLGENLARLLKIPQVTYYPDPVDSAASDEVRYQVNRFEGALDGPVTLDVSWQVYQRPANRVLTSQRSVYVIPPAGQGGDVPAYVGRLAEALGQWAKDIAAAVATR